MKKTGIVILNWNTADYLRRFLPGILASVRDADASLTVVDNASEDASLKVMEELFPEVRTIALDRNYGFTGGYNRALDILRGEYEYYVLMNSDIEVADGWLEPLVRWMDGNPNCAACAPKLRSYHDRDSFEYAGAAGGYIDRFGYPLCRGRVMGRTEKDTGQYDDADRNVFWVSGACMMVRSGLFHEAGGLDGRFFAHMEEIDLCWRLQLEGWRICSVTDSVVWHLGGGTLPSGSPWKLKLNFRNNLLMLSNNLAKSYAVKALYGGCSPEKAAGKGLRRARFCISVRMALDCLSAAVYLASLRKDSFMAVLGAHREFRRMRRDEDCGALAAWLGSGKRRIRIRGWYRGWAVLSSLVWRDRVFSRITRFYG